MAGPNSIRYVLEIDDQGSPRLIRFGQNAQHAGQQAQASFMSTARAMGNLSLAGMGVSAMMGKIASGTMAVVEAARRYDSLQVRLKGIEGGATQASIAFAKLQELSKLPGLGFEQAADAYAGLRSLKQNGPEAVAIIEAFARANASMGGGAENFGRAMRQIQQIIGKGKLMSEDVNTIAESIPNFRALMLDAFGTTSSEAINAKYSMDEFLKGIQEASKKLPAPAETITNNLDNLDDAWVRLKASFANTDGIKSATRALADMVEQMAIAMENAPKLVAEMERNGNSLATKKERGLLYKAIDAVLPMKETYGYRRVLETSQSMASQSYSQFMATYVPPASSVAAGAKIEHDKKKKTMAEEAKGDKAAKKKENLLEYWKATTPSADTITQNVDLMELYPDWYGSIPLSEMAMTSFNDQADKADHIAQENALRAQGYYVDLAQSSSAVLAQSFAQIGEGFGAMTDTMLSGFKNMMIQMVAELAANAVIFGVLNLFSGGAAGTFAKGFTGLSGLLMGHATGGYVGGGEASIVGERRSEIFVPRSAGRIEPTTAGAGQSITIIVRNPAEAQSTARALRKDARQRNTGLS